MDVKFTMLYSAIAVIHVHLHCGLQILHACLHIHLIVLDMSACHHVHDMSNTA